MKNIRFHVTFRTFLVLFFINQLPVCLKLLLFRLFLLPEILLSSYCTSLEHGFALEVFISTTQVKEF